MIFIVGATTAAGPAAAQSRSGTETGSHISRPLPAVIGSGAVRTEEEEGRFVLNNFARCTVDNDPKRVAAAIQLDPGADSDLLRRAASSNCLGNGMLRLSSGLYRGAIFSELYRRYAKDPKSLSGRFPARPLDLTLPLAADASDEGKTNRALLTFAACAYAVQPDAVKNIVVSATGSSAQKTAYAMLIPHLGQCLLKDEKVTFSRAMLEGAFGEYLYRSQMTTGQSPIGKPN